MSDFRPGRLFATIAVAMLCAVSAFAQLNPRVNVLPRPQSPVPGECEEGLAPAQPRTPLLAQTPAVPQPPATPIAPPTLDLETKLRAVEAAAQSGDRETFKSALAAAHAAIAAYPPGGERNAASDVVRIYDDLERLWDYAFTSPSGAFFDASTEGGDLLTMLRRYPGFENALADATLNVNGTVVYPTAESRTFLTAEASRRLTRLGVKMPERYAEVPPQPASVTKAPPPPPQPKPQPRIAHREAKPPAPHAMPATRLRTTPHAAKRGTPHAAPHAVTQRPKPATKVARAETARPNSRVAKPTPAPGAPLPPITPEPAPTTATTPTAIATTPSSTEVPPAATASTPAPTTSTMNPAAPASRSSGRVNLLFAIILIVVGIGVLIVLLRASD